MVPQERRLEIRMKRREKADSKLTRGLSQRTDEPEDFRPFRGFQPKSIPYV